MRRNPLLIYFGHHKCATTWINGIIENICLELNWNFVKVYNADMFNHQLGNFARANKVEFLSYGNSDIRFASDLGHFLAFHVVRDPRDIIVSAYFSHLHSHPTAGWEELQGYRATLQKLSKEDGLLQELEFSRPEMENLYNWNYAQPEVLELQMEDLMRWPFETIIKAFTHLNIVDESFSSLRKIIVYSFAQTINYWHRQPKSWLPWNITVAKMPLANVLAHIYRNRYSVQSEGRQPGQENVHSHYRKGVAGDWVNHFTPEHKAYFKKNYNEVLLKLGYETSSDW